MSDRLTPEKLLEMAGYMQDEGNVSRETLSPPVLPIIGYMVHFYNKAWDPVGPYAATVTAVGVQSSDDAQIVAIVSLAVAGLDHTGIYHDAHEAEHPWIGITDVPGVTPGTEHDHEFWWQWP